MKITYSLHGQEHEFEAQESEDLRQLAGEVEEYLRAEHDELRADDMLPVRVSDGLLDSLSVGTDVELIELRELQPRS